MEDYLNGSPHQLTANLTDLQPNLAKSRRPKLPPEYAERTPRTPAKANEIAKFWFDEVQGSDSEEAVRFFGESIVYRDLTTRRYSRERPK